MYYVGLMEVRRSEHGPGYHHTHSRRSHCHGSLYHQLSKYHLLSNKHIEYHLPVSCVGGPQGKPLRWRVAGATLPQPTALSRSHDGQSSDGFYSRIRMRSQGQQRPRTSNRVTQVIRPFVISMGKTRSTLDRQKNGLPGLKPLNPCTLCMK